MREDDIRAAEKAVVEAATAAHHVKPGYMDSRVRLAVIALEALQSPLPSREEMAEHAPSPYAEWDRRAEIWGAFWLLWVAEQPIDANLLSSLRKWADELFEGRS